MAFCGNCGAQVPNGTKFCPACGKPIISATPQDLSAVTPSPAPAPAPVPEQAPTPAPEPIPVQQAQPVQEQVVTPPPVQPMQQPVQQSVVPPTPQPVQQPVQQQPGIKVIMSAESDMESGEDPEPVVGTYQMPAGAAYAQKQKGKSNLPLILAVAGGVAALIIIVTAVKNVLGGVAAASDKSTALSDMLYQAAYNRQYINGGSAPGGSSQGAMSGSADAQASGGAGSVEIADYASVTGETAETDIFTVLVPEGWAAFPVKSTSGDGSFDQMKLNLIKGGQSSDDLWTKNAIKIEVANYNASYSVYMDAFENYEDVTLPLGDYTYTGPAGEYSGGWECAMLSSKIDVDGGEGFIAGSVFYKVNDEVISLSDPDVQAILASVKVK